MKLDSMMPSTPRRTPEEFLSTTVSPVHVESNEAFVQLTRIGLVRPMLVPDDPTPPSPTQLSLDMVSRSNAKPAIIPFFAPKLEVVIEQVGINQGPGSTELLGNIAYEESVKAVQGMGLPLFLAEYNTQALRQLFRLQDFFKHLLMRKVIMMN